MLTQGQILVIIMFFFNEINGSKLPTDVFFVYFLLTPTSPRPLQPLGRLGATVSGIDPVEDSVRIAQQHAAHDPDLRDRVSYRACTLEELAGEGEAQLEPEPEQGVTQFDAVVASEVVEHLADLDTFAVCCSRVLKVHRLYAFVSIHFSSRLHSYGNACTPERLRLCIWCHCGLFLKSQIELQLAIILEIDYSTDYCDD